MLLLAPTLDNVGLLMTDVKWRLLFFRHYFDVTRYDVGVWADVKGRKCRTL